jgi:hypothetical protein
MFGIGITEIAVFMIFSFVCIGVPVAIVFLLVFLLRKP